MSPVILGRRHRDRIPQRKIAVRERDPLPLPKESEHMQGWMLYVMGLELPEGSSLEMVRGYADALHTAEAAEEVRQIQEEEKTDCPY